ncbi:MAG: DoxX family membrane protein [Planctomycetota bacterium]|nr:DoxX family membrane protein [Planctomycetota bacterium]
MTQARSMPAIGVFTFILRLVLGGLFVFAAVMKLQDIQGFAFSVKAFELFPASADHAPKLLAFVVPWTELLVGLLLILGLWTRAASMLLALILIGFIAGIISVLARDLNVSCGCFGRFEKPCTGPISSCHIVRNCVLLLATLFVLWKGPGSVAIDRQDVR